MKCYLDFEVRGTVAALPGLEIPKSVKIHWMNFVEGDDVRDGTAWTWITKSDEITNSSFNIKVCI